MKLTELKARELIEGYKNRDFSCEEVTKAYIENIKEKENEINAYVTVCEDKAIESAKKIDEKFRNREEVGLLAGIPISVKDNIALKDVRMTCSSKILENFISPYDAIVSERIKKNDGVILGKVNMDEFAMGVSTKTSYFGVSKNPLNTKLVSGGSSGGSAASIAAYEAALSVGTDTGGSTRQPASFCGVVGIKPTYGTIPRYGVTSMANTFDQVGSMARDVEDAFLLLKALEGRDVKDATSVGNEEYRKNLTVEYADEFLKNLNIAIPKFILEMELQDRVKEDFNKAIKIFEDAGAKISYVDLESIKYVVETYHILVNGEIAPNLARFDGLRYGSRLSGDNYEDMFRKTRGEGFGSEVKKRIMIGTHILSLELAKDYYYKALKVRSLIKRDIENVLNSNQILMTPTVPRLPFKIDEQMRSVDLYMTDLFTIPANMAGLPSMSVPMPKGEDGLSVGILLNAARFKDMDMINAALGFERRVK